MTKCKAKVSPGTDEISNEMIINVWIAADTKLLHIYNHSWVKGTVPQSSRERTTIPIHNKGKSKSQTSSNWPISLTTCVGKIWNEKSTANWRGQKSELIPAPQQAGFIEMIQLTRPIYLPVPNNWRCLPREAKGIYFMGRINAVIWQSVEFIFVKFVL